MPCGGSADQGNGHQDPYRRNDEFDLEIQVGGLARRNCNHFRCNVDTGYLCPILCEVDRVSPCAASYIEDLLALEVAEKRLNHDFFQLKQLFLVLSIHRRPTGVSV